MPQLRTLENTMYANKAFGSWESVVLIMTWFNLALKFSIVALKLLTLAETEIKSFFDFNALFE